MIPAPLTDKEAKASFTKWLNRAVAQGELPPDDVGLDYDTTQALDSIALVHPNPSASLILRAKARFAEQLKRNA